MTCTCLCKPILNVSHSGISPKYCTNITWGDKIDNDKLSVQHMLHEKEQFIVCTQIRAITFTSYTC